MGVRSSASDSTSAAGVRLKREDFRRTKHDSAFSQWKILIGSLDWEDHSRGKEGAERYRTQNIPNGSSCPGVYELGVAASGTKLDSTCVVPVYLGQSDNLRNRMQQYGRDGDHLENAGLFTSIFSRGLPIVYRSAPMNTKKDAEITEKQLLDRFDYAWNRGSNGSRRQDDILKKLERLQKASKFSLVVKKLLFTKQKEVGIKITSGSNSSNSIFSRILGSKRLQARPFEYNCGDNICGVAIGDGSVCTTRPAAGRKRCGMHKGLRVNGYTSKLNTESDQIQHFLSCGFILDDGSPCKSSPIRGNKRCLEHKGRRIRETAKKMEERHIW